MGVKHALRFAETGHRRETMVIVRDHAGETYRTGNFASVFVRAGDSGAQTTSARRQCRVTTERATLLSVCKSAKNLATNKSYECLTWISILSYGILGHNT